MEFRNGFGCYSLAGRDGGRQDIVLGPYCAEEHTLIHEVFFHVKNNQDQLKNPDIFGALYTLSIKY